MNLKAVFSNAAVSPPVVALSKAKRSSSWFWEELGWRRLAARLDRGELGEDRERFVFWRAVGDLGLPIVRCVLSTVAAVTVSLTCNGEGVDFRGVLRPSTERGTCALCRYPSKSWAAPEGSLCESRLACSAVPDPETIIASGMCKGDGVAPRSYD